MSANKASMQMCHMRDHESHWHQSKMPTAKAANMFDGGGGRNVWLDLLAVLFGMASWISVNGLWVELPVLVSVLPESWALASYLSVIVQIANLGPISYALLRWRFGDERISKTACIYLLLIVGVISSVLLVFLWDETATIGGVGEYSVGLLALVFFLSLVDCSSSVLFLPFMAMFRATYLNSYLVGEGMSGLVPGVIALAQGVGGNPYCENVTSNGTWSWEVIVPEARFSVEVFFSILCAMMLFSSAAFVLMNNVPSFRLELVNSGDAYVKPAADYDEEDADKSATTVASTKSYDAAAVTTGMSTGCPGTPCAIEPPVKDMYSGLIDSGGLREGPFCNVSGQFYQLMALQFCLCFVSNGFLASIGTYSTLPYGNTVYHLSVTLSSMANPAMAFFAFFFPTYNVGVIYVLSLLGSGFAGFILTTALNSPDMVAGQTLGGTLVVLSWILYVGIVSYVKVSIAGWCRRRGKSSLFYYGSFTQAGSAFGAVLAFALVNCTGVFQQYYVQCGDDSAW